MFWLDYIIAIEDLTVKRQSLTFIEPCAMPKYATQK